MRLLALLAPVFAAGIAGFFAATSARQGETDFATRSQHPAPLQTADVEAAVSTAPEPGTGSGRGRARGTRADCRPGREGELRNPWSCRITYRSGTVARYSVTIRPDGSFHGDHLDGTGSITGCCVSARA